ncbi:hypothetical protein L914_10182 [Phytophthora nicotianae]|uniref:Uncharacterized protein n=1 Tax=Phytophthora nicotianae TaxID=4792 RepID=W2N7S0_PHYNI|nr:hypothetical protein L914_10182 [Phytophthora nicotianae]
MLAQAFPVIVGPRKKASLRLYPAKAQDTNMIWSVSSSRDAVG